MHYSLRCLHRDESCMQDAHKSGLKSSFARLLRCVPTMAQQLASTRKPHSPKRLEIGGDRTEL